MGDVLALIEKARQAVDAREAERLAERLTRNEFTLEDLRDQIKAVRRMGPLRGVLDALPRVGPMKGLDKLGDVDEKRVVRTAAIIDSMTPQERRTPGILNAGRKRRVARGSGTSVQEVNQLLKQYLQMKKLMKGLRGNWLRKAFGR
jgi:signal recognition particle subunit SRP54